MRSWKSPWVSFPIWRFLSLCVTRKAIAKSSLHHLSCQPSTSTLSRADPEASIRSTVDWTVSHDTHLLSVLYVWLYQILYISQNVSSSASHFHPLCLQESAVCGDHIWFETNVSGEYCYVGEQHCVARGPVSISRFVTLCCKLPVQRVQLHICRSRYFAQCTEIEMTILWKQKL